MNSKFSSVLSEINSVAIGDNYADLILQNCSLINVYTNEIQKKIQISIKNDRITASLASFASGIFVIPITSALQDLYKLDSANVEN